MSLVQKPEPDFAVEVHPVNGNDIVQGSEKNFDIVLSALGSGAPSNVKLLVGGLPPNVTMALAPDSIAPTPAGPNARLTIKVGDAFPDTYTIHVAALGKSYARFASFDI